jgi:uncharacterized membrane protein YfcA
MLTSKRITLAIAILSTLATALLALTGTLPPVWAALTASLGAGAYALVRTLQKRAEGATWKSLLATTEARGAILAAVGSIVAALAGVLPPEYAATAVVVAGVMLKMARVLQAGLPEGPKSIVSSSTELTGPPARQVPIARDRTREIP